MPAPQTVFTLQMITTSAPMSLQSGHDQSYGVVPYEAGKSPLPRRISTIYLILSSYFVFEETIWEQNWVKAK
jgi:hypothetical protein